jgi:hypothetical protein
MTWTTPYVWVPTMIPSCSKDRASLVPSGDKAMPASGMAFVETFSLAGGPGRPVRETDRRKNTVQSVPGRVDVSKTAATTNVRSAADAITDTPQASLLSGSGTVPVTDPLAESRTTASSPVAVRAAVR